MAKIIVLSKETTELIAAGEVVERPASVVKELLENSVDAGATAITLEIKNGGITYIRITDNGCGIARDDVRAAFLSHATSKIRQSSDLEAIYTLGFRGEALASVAAVARVELLSRAQEEETGTRFTVEGGEQGEPEDAGCPKGTTLIIHDLFYNTPARMKFLKKDVAEANAVAGVVDRIALSHPEVSFRFIRDGKETLFTSGDGKLDSAVYSVFGREFLAGLVPVNYEHNSVKVTGFTTKPSGVRPNRGMQFFFLNGRLIKTGTGSAALSEAYRNSIMVGKFPACVLNLSVPPHTVDVNVHPAKIEVRFADEKNVFNAVYYGVKNALEGDTSRVQFVKKDDRRAVGNYLNMLEAQSEKPEQLTIQQPVQKNEDFWSRIISKPSSPKPLGQEDDDADEKRSGGFILPLDDKTKSGFAPDAERENDFLVKGTAVKQESTEQTQVVSDAATAEVTSYGENNNKNQEKAVDEQPGEVPEFRIIGEAFKTYIMIECKEKILVIDKHAAHERIVFEQLKASGGESDRQLLLEPVTVTLNKEEYTAAIENTELLEKSGFGVQDFGSGTVIVGECPMLVDSGDIRDIIIELAGYLAANKTELVSEKIDRIYHTTACKAAVKAGDFTSDYEMRRFTEKLLSMPEIRCCPHGRPVLIELSRRELEKNFGRVQ